MKETKWYTFPAEHISFLLCLRAGLVMCSSPNLRPQDVLLTLMWRIGSGKSSAILICPTKTHTCKRGASINEHPEMARPTVQHNHSACAQGMECANRPQWGRVETAERTPNHNNSAGDWVHNEVFSPFKQNTEFYFLFFGFTLLYPSSPIASPLRGGDSRNCASCPVVRTSQIILQVIPKRKIPRVTDITLAFVNRILYILLEIRYCALWWCGEGRVRLFLFSNYHRIFAGNSRQPLHLDPSNLRGTSGCTVPGQRHDLSLGKLRDTGN